MKVILLFPILFCFMVEAHHRESRMDQIKWKGEKMDAYFQELDKFWNELEINKLAFEKEDLKSSKSFNNDIQKLKKSTLKVINQHANVSKWSEVHSLVLSNKDNRNLKKAYLIYLDEKKLLDLNNLKKYKKVKEERISIIRNMIKKYSLNKLTIPERPLKRTFVKAYMRYEKNLQLFFKKALLFKAEKVLLDRLIKETELYYEINKKIIEQSYIEDARLSESVATIKDGLLAKYNQSIDEINKNTYRKINELLETKYNGFTVDLTVKRKVVDDINWFKMNI